MQSNCRAQNRTQGTWQCTWQCTGQCMGQCMNQCMRQGKTGEAGQAEDLLCLLLAEDRRIRRSKSCDLSSGLSQGLSSVQLVVLRPAVPAVNAQADACAGIRSLVQECDSVIAIDRETIGLFLPCATLPLARSFLKKALAGLAPLKAQGLLVTIKDSAFDDFCPSEIEEQIRAELTKGGSTGRTRHIVLGGDNLCDQSRVSAEERSFLLSPLSS